jgi:hypothetical protein
MTIIKVTGTILFLLEVGYFIVKVAKNNSKKIDIDHLFTVFFGFILGLLVFTFMLAIWNY